MYDLPESEILYFTIHRNAISVHTETASFFYPTSFEQILSAYHDKGFERVDRSYIAQLTQIQGYDESRQSIYFGNNDFIPVSAKNYPRILQHIRERKET
ncbi:LytTR family DNA-binding domain-containing protein [Paenibacillus sp. SI8]|uniref:LytTR family DNA-binding domain-containing protein n=1 Tax=unclassified Paenibacillus TaxID=185978 RepID=UPI003465FDB4